MPLMRKKQHRKRGEDEGMELGMATDNSLFGTVFLCCVYFRNERLKNEV
jgi:hypothetical protein